VNYNIFRVLIGIQKGMQSLQVQLMELFGFGMQMLVIT
jgi:hypothetical protein